MSEPMPKIPSDAYSPMINDYGRPLDPLGHHGPGCMCPFCGWQQDAEKRAMTDETMSARERLVPYVATSSDYASRTALVRADTAEMVAEAHAAAAMAAERERLRGMGIKWADAVDEMASFLERECPSTINVTKRLRAAALAFGVQRTCMEAAERERDEATARAERAEANYAFMVERACDENLDGYRELGARAAAAESRAEALAKEVERLTRILYDCYMRLPVLPGVAMAFADSVLTPHVTALVDDHSVQARQIEALEAETARLRDETHATLVRARAFILGVDAVGSLYAEEMLAKEIAALAPAQEPTP